MKNRRILITSILMAVVAIMLSSAVGAEPSTQLPAFETGSRLLFQEDSITDMQWVRKQSDRNHYFGHSYVFLLAARMGVEMPEAQLDFYNRGNSGNSVAALRKRWQADAIDIKPDILTVLIGTNDVGAGLKYQARTVTPIADILGAYFC